MKLADLAVKLGCELDGDGAVEICGVAPIETAGEGELTFVANSRYQHYLASTRAAAVIVGATTTEQPFPTLRTADPYLAFVKAIELFYIPLPQSSGIHPTAILGAGVTLGPDAYVGPYAVIGDDVRIGAKARIGAHTVLYPEVVAGNSFTTHAHVTVRERVRIGNDVTLHAGVVIGSDGFGYVPDGNRIRKIIQGGNVILEDEVEIGANSTVDRAAVGSTILRRGVKIDNLVQIAHGCEIGEGSMLAAQVGLAGSTTVGKWVRMGGQAGAAGHLTIGDGAQVAGKGGVANSVKGGTIVGGYPAVEIGIWRRYVASLPKLAGLLRRVRRLEQILNIEAEREGKP